MVKFMLRHLLQLFTAVLGCAWLSTSTWWDHDGRPGDGGEHSAFVAVRQLGQDVRNGSLARAQGNGTHADEEQAVAHERGHKALQKQTLRVPKYNNNSKNNNNNKKNYMYLAATRFMTSHTWPANG
ncbi:unnamed protein product [Polarella glacialis]|uniref:Secreted protein n=1 Tax=Polarella glacialis TaxID=89957 RepID=A0A813JDE8_POLGL|nr:unnamed protein product [Polarella glacialis]